MDRSGFLPFDLLSPDAREALFTYFSSNFPYTLQTNILMDSLTLVKSQGLASVGSGLRVEDVSPFQCLSFSTNADQHESFWDCAGVRLSVAASTAALGGSPLYFLRKV